MSRSKNKNCKPRGIKSHRSHISGRRGKMRPFGKFCKMISNEEHKEWKDRFREFEDEKA